MRSALPTLAWLAAFALLVAVVQVGAIEQEVIDWDEGAFILGAADLLRGNLPYVETFEHKPPAIFFALAAAFALFGESIAVVRLAGDAALLAMAAVTFLIARRFAPEPAAGVATLVMVAVTALPFGLFTSAELPATALMMTALLVLLEDRGSLRAAVVVGFLMSLAALFRMNLGFAVVAIGLYYAAGAVRQLPHAHRLAALGYAAGGLVPLAALLGAYAAEGHFRLAILAIFEVPLSYATSELGMLGTLRAHAGGWLGSIARRPDLFLSFTLLLILTGAGFLRGWRARAAERPGEGAELALLAAVAAATLLSILRGGAAYKHYLLQLYPFAAIWMAAGFAGLRPAALRGLAAGLAAVAITGAAVSGLPSFLRVASRPAEVVALHPGREIARRIAGDMEPGDRVWALYTNTIPWYLGLPPASPVVMHPSLITRASIMEPLVAAGYVPADELRRLMRSRPRYVEVGRSGGVIHYFGAEDQALFMGMLEADYDPWLTVDGITVYRRRD